MRWARRKDDQANVAGGPEVPQPYLDLAREIHAEVERVAADPSAHGDLLAELLDRIPNDQRMKLAQTIFDELSPDRQWELIERVYGDEEIRTYLEEERAARLETARLDAERDELCRAARARRALDARRVPRGEELTLGLFRDNDVRAAVSRGHGSSTCARRVILRALGDGRFQVVEDVFNPNGGYFVTGEYSEDTWRAHDRLGGHTVVRIGSLSESGGQATFEPELLLGGRVDFEIDGQAARGRLHLGFAMLSDLDVFVP